MKSWRTRTTILIALAVVIVGLPTVAAGAAAQADKGVAPARVLDSLDASFDAIPGFYPVREPFAVTNSRGGYDIDRDPTTGLLWHASEVTGEIYATNATGNEVASFGAPGSGDGELGEPNALAIRDGEIFVAESGNGRVQVFDLATGDSLRTIGQSGGAGPGSFTFPCGIAIVDNLVYVADAYRDDVQIFTLTGGYVGVFGSPGTGNGEFALECFSIGIAEFGGFLYVSDSGNQRVSVFDLDGNWQHHLASGMVGDPADLEFDGSGNLWIADRSDDVVRRFNRFGVPMGSIGGTGTGLGLMNSPIGLHVDPSGETLWVVSLEPTHRIQEFTSVQCQGQLLTHAGSSYADVLATDDVAAVIHLGRGNDRATTGSGDDLVCGGFGNDIIRTGAGADEVRAGLGNDTVFGLAGDDQLFGEGSNDTLSGGPGNDVIFGQGGVDTIRGNTGNDVLRGGAHDDTIGGDTGDDLIFGNTGADIVDGNTGDDIIRGQANPDTLLGGAGNDRLIGGGGKDVHNGGPGTDVCLEGASQGLPETYLSCETQP